MSNNAPVIDEPEAYGSDEPEAGQAVGVTYPDTVSGLLMRQRDDAAASASSARATADRYAAIAEQAEARVADLEAKIEQQGGA